MKEKIVFNKDFNLEDKFIYVSSPASKSKNKFIQKEDCIENGYNEKIKDYDYISIITKEKYKDGVTVRVKCSFDKFGAPLIVFTDDCKQLEDGSFQYGLHFEVVAYENGCNVWHIVPGKEDKNPIDVTKVDAVEFFIEDKSIVDMEVTIKEKKLYIRVNDKKFVAEHEDISNQMHVGITACEGINHFYEFEVDQKK
ncbi:MAG: hypothetical protein IKL49_03535 [Lachnospiraceae bacterium]|nr:hypothetical protein [Lachnospiraceae bacterium]